MRRIFLAGTTAGTTWRESVKEELHDRGVPDDAIFDPRLSPGQNYTQEVIEREFVIKDDPGTIVLIHICPGIVSDNRLTPAERQDRAERLGGMTEYELGHYPWVHSHRTAVFIDLDAYDPHRRSHRVLSGQMSHITRAFGETGPPLFPSLDAALVWSVGMIFDGHNGRAS